MQLGKIRQNTFSRIRHKGRQLDEGAGGGGGGGGKLMSNIYFQSVLALTTQPDVNEIEKKKGERTFLGSGGQMTYFTNLQGQNIYIQNLP